MGSATVQGELWGLAAKNWAQMQERTARPLWRAALAAVGAGKETKLLDAGCGAGGAASEAHALGCHVTGCDASDSLLAIARQRAPSATFNTCDLEKLPYADGSFDAVIAINSVFYCQTPVNAVRELARVTRPHGLVAVTAWGKPQECEMKAIFEAVMSTQPPRPAPPPDAPPPPAGTGGPFSLSADGALAALLGEAGLQHQRTESVLCIFDYPDLETCWTAQSSSGPVQAAIRTAGASTVRAAFEAAARNFTQHDGRVVFRNHFLYAVAQR